jgi:two-component system, NarL family, response regulator NreC
MMAGHLRLASDGTEAVSQSAPQPITVVLADDHALMRRHLHQLLDCEEGVDVQAEADDLTAAVSYVCDHNPKVLVLDLRMPNGSSLETISNLRQRAPKTQVVVLTMEDNPVFAQQALASGALGFVLKEHADSELLEAVRAAARGDEYVSPRLIARLDGLRRSLTDDTLTPREVSVLRLIALGHTGVEIGGKLHISSRTVEYHRARIHGKLGLAKRSELVRYALGRGLIRP